ncbi:serine/threonine-protein kinase STY8 [Salvia divinorum]|uniref:Serine/threonine-protein kinase STY8 n=1 Tax=Salvia divinorum TaxID=28513 RepID=A0ABD1GWU1_SALDI
MGASCMKERIVIVTECMNMGSLFKTLHRSNQPLDIRRRLRIALDVSRGMNY